MMREVVTDTVVACLEDAAFLFPIESELAVWAPALHAEISFECSFSGKLSICTTEQLGVTLAANLLGIEEDCEEARDSAGYAVSEILNIIGGLLVPQLSGAAGYSLGIPKVSQLDSCQLARAIDKSSVSISLDADGEPLVVTVYEDET